MTGQTHGGKGSKRRPTAKSFYDNWDFIFGDKAEEVSEFDWECLRCNKGLAEDDLYIVEDVNHEPFGDTTVERIEHIVHCSACGEEAMDVS